MNPCYRETMCSLSQSPHHLFIYSNMKFPELCFPNSLGISEPSMLPVKICIHHRLPVTPNWVDKRAILRSDSMPSLLFPSGKGWLLLFCPCYSPGCFASVSTSLRKLLFLQFRLGPFHSHSGIMTLEISLLVPVKLLWGQTLITLTRTVF